MNYRNILFLLTAALLTGCQHDTSKITEQHVDIVEVMPGPGSRHAGYPGQTEAESSTDLAFMVMGTVSQVYVKEGDQVKKGQVLARLDTRDYQTQLKATEAEYKQIKAECERVIAMHSEHAVSDNDYDKARSGLERIAAKLEHHRAQVNDCVLRAPYDGYVERMSVSAKEIVAPGVPVISIYTAGGTDIVINIPETEYSSLQNITSYRASFSAMPGQSFPLDLKSISPKANANQLYQARLVLRDEVPNITPGMTAIVDIEYGSDRRDLVQVPVGALWSIGHQSYVYLYNETTSTIRQTTVRVDRLKADGNAVVSNGLHLGDKIVASGTHRLTDGQTVVPLQNGYEITTIE